MGGESTPSRILDLNTNGPPDTAHPQLSKVPTKYLMDPTYPLIPIANFIGLFLALVSLVGLINRPWNTGVFMLAVYISLKSLTFGVNTIVWSDNVNDVAPIWYDICE